MWLAERLVELPAMPLHEAYPTMIFCRVTFRKISISKTKQKTEINTE